MPHILFVCTANVCRSPLAEAVMRNALMDSPTSPRFQILSAGTHAHVGDAMCSVGATLLDDLGIPHHKTADRLSSDALMEADLVLVAERRHRSFAATLAPDSARKIFTMTEASALANFVAGRADARGGPAAVGFDSWVAALDGARGMVAPPAEPRRGPFRARTTASFDIGDGHQLRARAHRETLGLVLETTVALAPHVRAAALRG
jgi:protein-tyrosine phosphatase